MAKAFGIGGTVLLAALLASAVPGHAQTPVAQTPAATANAIPAAKLVVQPLPAVPPANTVRCGFENLTIEDREITLLLIGLDFQAFGRFGKSAPDNKLVNRLVAEALDKCVRPYRWSADAAAAASKYSHGALVIEVLRQAIEYGEHAVDPIDSYFAKNQAELTKDAELSDAAGESFDSYLKQNGWRPSERSAIRLARAYLDALVARAANERSFAKSVARPAPKPKSPKRLARPAKRGRT